MGRFLNGLMIGLLTCAWVVTVAAEGMPVQEITKEQIKGLDNQIQDIKSDVLDISGKLIQLEEKLIYPSNTRLAIFLAVAQGDKSRLGAVTIKIDGKDAANHTYTPKELDALQHGGVQRFYTGNVRNGEHALEVTLTGKSASNNDYQQNASYKFTKDVSTKLIEITVAATGAGNQGISFKD